jgi:hypothetical protein
VARAGCQWREQAAVHGSHVVGAAALLAAIAALLAVNMMTDRQTDR